MLSPVTSIVMTFVVSFAEKSTMPVGSAPPKSAALVPLVAVPVTAK